MSPAKLDYNSIPFFLRLHVRVKVFGFAAWSGSGKTTMIENLIPLLAERGFRVSVIKHAHHAFDVDKPGKDSFRHRQAGASEVLVSSSARWALMHELHTEGEPELPQLLARLSPCDLVLVEGFKLQPIPKLEIHRKSTGSPHLYPGDPHIVAVATDARLDTGLPQFALGDYPAIVRFMLDHLGLTQADGGREAASKGQVGDNPDDES